MPARIVTCDGSRLGFKRRDSLVRGPAAEPRPCRTERRPERSYDALGPRYRRAWKPPFLPRPFMAIDNRFFRSVRVALNATSGPQIRRHSRLCSRRSAGCFPLPAFWLFLLLPRCSWQEHRGREIQTQKYRSHKSMSNSLPIAWKAPPTYTSHRSVRAPQFSDRSDLKNRGRCGRIKKYTTLSFSQCPQRRRREVEGDLATDEFFWEFETGWQGFETVHRFKSCKRRVGFPARRKRFS